MGGQKGAPLSSRELSLFCSQIFWLLKAAIPLEEGIAAVCENTQDTREKKLLQDILSSLAQTGSFSLSLKKSGAFPEYLVNMMEIGEKAGKLDDVSSSLSVYYEREDDLKSQIRGAVIYPLVLILMIAAVVAVLIVKVLPVFRQVLETLGGDVPAVSVAAVQFSLTVGQGAFVLILALALLIAVGALAARTRKGADFFRALLGRFPPARRAFSSIDAARFSSVLSMLLSSGYEIAQALELLPGILSSPQGSGKAREISRKVSQGRPFSQALQQSGLFSGIYSSMIGVGEKTGNLDAVMNRIAEHYNEEVQNMLSGMTVMIEPVMVGLLSVIIGIILLSIMLPMMGIMSNIS